MELKKELNFLIFLKISTQMQERHIVVEGEISYCRSLFSESDNTLPVKLIHSSGVVLVFSASATLAQY